MKLYNTMSRTVEEFKPIIDGEVSMYTCGPTVYDIAHIGNLRKYICDDILYRTLRADNFEVKRVMNITDVDDKTIKKADGKKVAFDELTRGYEEDFFADLNMLNILPPTQITRATEYIDKMVDFVLELIAKGFAYKTADGSVYFAINKFADYGKLSNLDNREIKVGARIDNDEYDKENPSDFALWKAWDENDGEIYWQTSLGKGRPGWHIECSAMSMDTLGETIDIHTGGVDNIFPHHENEIAQSEAKSGKKFVDYWVHNEHLLVDGKKMSKSLGNFYRLSDIINHGFSPLDFRYFVIGAYYRSKLNFTWEGLEAARNTRRKITNLFLVKPNEQGKAVEKYYQEFLTKINEDLNTSEALAVFHELIKDDSVSYVDKYETVKKMDNVLGLDLFSSELVDIPDEVKDLADKRKNARENKDFAKSDELRDKINSFGWIVEDKDQNEYELKKK